LKRLICTDDRNKELERKMMVKQNRTTRVEIAFETQILKASYEFAERHFREKRAQQPITLRKNGSTEIRQNLQKAPKFLKSTNS
jgi:hypothetical protein